MKRALPLLFLLAACGTPQEMCIQGATRDLRVVDRLISETEGNLARGYAYEETTISTPFWVDCTRPVMPPPSPATSDGTPPPPPPPRLCRDERTQTVTRPVAIDLRAEKAKLDSLKAKRAELARAAAATIERCKAENPE